MQAFATIESEAEDRLVACAAPGTEAPSFLLLARRLVTWRLWVQGQSITHEELVRVAKQLLQEASPLDPLTADLPRRLS
jgi:hypothetical protein